MIFLELAIGVQIILMAHGVDSWDYLVLMKFLPISVPLNPTIWPWVSENAGGYSCKFIVLCMALKFGIIIKLNISYFFQEL